MDCQKLYTDIVRKRKEIPSEEEYTEKHHIVPRCLGGSDEKENLVVLSAKEHFICHLLLVKIQQKGSIEYFKMLNAFIMMNCQSTCGQKRYFSSRIYSALKKEYSKYRSDSTKGENNPAHGTKWICIPDTLINKKISLSENIPDGWVRGRNLVTVSCSCCGTMMLQPNKNQLKNCVECIREEKEKRVEKPRNKIPIQRTPKKVEKTCIKCGTTFIGKRKFCSDSCYDKRGNTGMARKVMDDSGKIFSTLTEAAKEYKVTVEAIRYRIKSGKYEYV